MKTSVSVKYIKAFLFLLFFAVGSLAIVSLIPNRMVEANVTYSRNFAPSGEYVNALDFKIRGSILDKPTESVMLKNSLNNESMNPLKSIMDAQNYARYWHGYLIVLRPLLVFTDITGIYYVNMFVFYGLLAVLLYYIAVKLKPSYAVFLMLAMVPAHFYIIPCCMQYIGVFVIAFISSIIVLRNQDCDIGLLLFITGCLTSFFDFLTAPLITLILPLSLYLLMKEKQLSVKDQLLSVVKYSILWGIGYVFFWASKWIIGSLVLQKNVLLEAGNSLNERTGTFYMSRSLSVVGVINVYFGFHTIYMAVCIAIEVFAFTVLVMKKKHCIFWKLLIQIIPIIWYFLTSNHSLQHNFMTYRNVIVIAWLGIILVESAIQNFRKESNA